MGNLYTVAHVEGMSMLTTLETMEQELIQHIRTSGVSQSRELSLIDEVMNICDEHSLED